MEQNPNLSPKASTDERASSSSNAAADAAQTESPPFFVASLVSSALDDTFPIPERRRSTRHDGWTADKITGFIEALCACGVVADACKTVRLSPQSAYAFRNRRAGRAFGVAWDAALIHRGRGRLSDELMSRAINGCLELTRDKDGEVAGERHRYDNRLSMAVLTRLDRLAERQNPNDALLRAVSEDLDDYLEVVETGGDVDAFVDARRPPPEPLPAIKQAPDTKQSPAAEQPPAAESAPAAQRIENEWDRMAYLLGCLDYKAANPHDIDLDDLRDADIARYTSDQLLRAHYSGYLAWCECIAQDRAEIYATVEGAEEDDIDWDAVDELEELDESPRAFKAALAALSAEHAGEDAPAYAAPPTEPPEAETPTQPSTSST